MGSLRSLLTTRGKALVGAGIVLVVAGIAFGFVDLIRVGVLAIVMPFAAALLVRSRRTRMQIERRITPDRVSVGQPAQVTMTLQNVSDRTTPLFLAEERLDYVLGDRPRFVVGRIAPKQTRTVEYSVCSHVRGHHALGPLGAQVPDPFGLASRAAVLEGTTDLVVLPAVHPLSASRQPSTGVGAEGEQAHLLALHGEDDVTVREYRDGDDLRRIHWPSTARTGDLMVRQEDRPTQRRAILLLDPRPTAHGGTGVTGSFEWAVEAVASIAAHLTDNGYAVHLVCVDTVDTGRAGDAQQIDEILETLAVTQQRADTGEDDVLRAAQALTDAGGFVVAVIGASDPDATARVASLRQVGTTGLAVVIDAASFGPAPDADEVGSHVDLLRLAGWRAVPVTRGDSIERTWDVLTTVTVGAGQ